MGSSELVQPSLSPCPLAPLAEVAAMKAKQSSELGPVDTLDKAIEAGAGPSWLFGGDLGSTWGSVRPVKLGL